MTRVLAILEGVLADTRVTRLTIAFAAVVRACARKGTPLHVGEAGLPVWPLRIRPELTPFPSLSG